MNDPPEGMNLIFKEISCICNTVYLLVNIYIYYLFILEKYLLDK